MEAREGGWQKMKREDAYPIKSACLFCASAADLDQAYLDAAKGTCL